MYIFFILLSIVLIVCFWWVFLPLALIGGVIVGGVILYFNAQSKQESKAAEIRQEQLQRSTYTALETAKSVSPEKREWRFLYSSDPVTGQKRATSAILPSDDGLCKLQIDVHLDGSRFVWLTCDGLPSWDRSYSSDREVEIKYDTEPLSTRIKVETAGKQLGEYPYKYDALRVYGCKTDPQYPSRCDSVERFLSKLTTIKKMGFRSDMKYRDGKDYWTVFSLTGIQQALVKIGMLAEQAEVKQDSTSTLTSNEPTQEKQAQYTHVVYPGERVGNFILGMTKEQAIKIGKPHFRYNLVDDIQTWVYVNKTNGNMLGATFANDSLIAVCFTSNKFDTEDGITIDNFDKPNTKLVAFYPSSKSLIGTLDKQPRVSLLVSRYSHVSGGLFYTIDTDGQRKGCINK